MAFLPEWYEGPHYRNVEDVVAQWFQGLLPDVRVVHWLKPGWYTPGDGQGTEPTLRIWRMPGTRDNEIRSDVALIQVAAVTRARADSWKLLEFVGDMFDVCNNGYKIVTPQNQKVQLKDVEIWLGPQEVPEGLIDEFFIPMTWSMSINGLKLAPNYRQILENL